MRELLRDREFAAYFAARQGARLAYSIETVAVGWQIYGLRHSALDLGLVGLILFIPQLLLAVPAGMLADIVDRRILCAVCAVGQAAGVSTFVALTLNGARSLAVNFAAVALIGIAHSLSAPAERTLLAGIVRSERFAHAQAMTTSLSECIKILGPALGGFLIAGGLPIAFAAAAASYILAACAFLFLTPRPMEKTLSEPKAAVDGIRFILRRPVVFGAISLDLFAVFFGGATALLPIYATQILHAGPIVFGALRSAPAIGAALVAAYLAHHTLPRRVGILLMWSVAGFGAATIVFGLSRNIALSFAALALAGGFDVVSVVIRAMLVQLDAPDEMRGRISGIENIFICASNELGDFESGGLAALIGVVPAVTLGGVATLAVIALWAKLFPALRSYERASDALENEIRSPAHP